MGSKVSTCDGPPFMNRKMTRFAFAGKCPAFGASGPAARVVAASGPRVAGQHAGEAERAEPAADAAEHLAARERTEWSWK